MKLKYTSDHHHMISNAKFNMSILKYEHMWKDIIILNTLCEMLIALFIIFSFKAR